MSTPRAKIVSRVTSDTQDFSDVVSLITNLVSQSCWWCVLIIWLVRIDARLTLLLLLMSPVAAGIALASGALPAASPSAPAG